MESLVIFVHVLAAIGITGLVLIQHGKGADMGASFGSGASQTIFGSVGSGNALTKSTSWLATVFFATSLVLALFAKQQTSQAIEDESLILNTGVIDETPAVVQDIPTLESVQSDVPQTPTAESVPVEPEQAPVDEAVATDSDTTEQAEAEAPEEEPAETPAQ